MVLQQSRFICNDVSCMIKVSLLSVDGVLRIWYGVGWFLIMQIVDVSIYVQIVTIKVICVILAIYIMGQITLIIGIGKMCCR